MARDRNEGNASGRFTPIAYTENTDAREQLIRVLEQTLRRARRPDGGGLVGLGLVVVAEPGVLVGPEALVCTHSFSGVGPQAFPSAFFDGVEKLAQDARMLNGEDA